MHPFLSMAVVIAMTVAAETGRAVTETERANLQPAIAAEGCSGSNWTTMIEYLRSTIPRAATGGNTI